MPQPEDTAGLYWRPYVTCDDCVAPRALVAYLTTDEREARAIRRALEGTLALGLPYAIHTDELGMAPRAIAIVAGSYRTQDAAERAAAARPVIAGRRATAIALDPEADPPEAPRHVTVVDLGGPVPAWSKADVDAAQAALDASSDPAAHATPAAMHAWVQRQLAARPAMCTVLPGDLFVVEDSDLDWYELAPVHCGGELAYIRWTSSLLGHAVIVRRNGRQTLSQVVGAECDAPIIHAWRYDAEGRHDDAAPHDVVASAGC